MVTQYPVIIPWIEVTSEASAKTELPVQSQVPGTQAYVCPQIPKELIGHTEIAYKGPDAEPVLYLRGHAPKQDHIVRQTIHFSSRYPQEVFDDKTYVQVAPLPDDSPDIPKFQTLMDIVRKFLEQNPYYSAPQCDQVEGE